jgi:hypothetical protein
MKRAIWISAAMALALVGCSKKTTTKETEVTQVDKAMPSASASATPPAAPPERKAGLWEQTMSSDRINQTTRVCLDKSVQDKLSWTGQQAGKSGCEKSSVTPRVGGGWEFNSVCDLGAGGRVVSHGVACGDFGDHYSVEIDSTTTGAAMPQANGDHKMKLEASWKGPCPADMKPGDMELPGGMKLNMAGAMAGRPMGSGGPPSSADIAKMRAQALEMAKAAKGQP